MRMKSKIKRMFNFVFETHLCKWINKKKNENNRIIMYKSKNSDKKLKYKIHHNYSYIHFLKHVRIIYSNKVILIN